MPRFRKKPVEIEAVRWTGENIDEVRNFIGFMDRDEDNCIPITTLEGVMDAAVGDWIIKGIKGEFYPCKPHIFDLTYELVE